MTTSLKCDCVVLCFAKCILSSFFYPPALICVILDLLLIKNYSLSESLARSCSDSHAILHLPPFLPFTLTSFYGGNK